MSIIIFFGFCGLVVLVSSIYIFFAVKNLIQKRQNQEKIVNPRETL